MSHADSSLHYRRHRMSSSNPEAGFLFQRSLRYARKEAPGVSFLSLVHVSNFPKSIVIVTKTEARVEQIQTSGKA